MPTDELMKKGHTEGWQTKKNDLRKEGRKEKMTNESVKERRKNTSTKKQTNKVNKESKKKCS